MASNIHTKTPAALRRARSGLLEHGEIPANAPVDALVARSWERSLRAGLMPAGHLPDSYHLNGYQLARALDRQQELLTHARPMMEYLYGQTRESDSMVILANEGGLLLQAMGDPDILNRAERVALAPGVSWHERYRGTNAIGTALAEAVPVVINGSEHYLERNGFLTCAAAPIAAPDGRLLGVLDISGDYRRHHPHTFCLVRSVARTIENSLFRAFHGGHLQLRFHPLAEGIGTPAEGVFALTEDGYAVGANRAALELFGLGPADLGITHLESMFQARINDLLDWSGRRSGEPVPLRTAQGRWLFVRIETDRVLRNMFMPAEKRPADALTRLDTGCGRLRAAIDKARKVLDKPIPILLRGESGVGKEVFAQAMHGSGPRRTRPFVAIDCSALPENLIESELFGYAPGAYTGARRTGSTGRIREAEGGTLFLDEIGDMPLTMQSRLLRVLQERKVTPLGSGKAVAVDFALICATHRDLRAEMEASRFRADLYYRINGLTLMLPPLRERTDFTALLNRLLETLAPDRGVAFDADVAAALADFHWPGNIRQLINALRTSCALLGEDEDRIDWSHLPDDLAEELRRPALPANPDTALASENLHVLSEAAIARAVALSRGNMSEAARRLGISRNTLYRRIKK